MDLSRYPIMKHVAPEFESIFLEFTTICQLEAIPEIPIGFADIEGSAAGLCIELEDGTKEILIDEPYWNSANDRQRAYIVYHELGHCVLGLAHSARGLMNPDTPPAYIDANGSLEESCNSKNQNK